MDFLYTGFLRKLLYHPQTDKFQNFASLTYLEKLPHNSKHLHESQHLACLAQLRKELLPQKAIDLRQDGCLGSAPGRGFLSIHSILLTNSYSCSSSAYATA